MNLIFNGKNFFHKNSLYLRLIADVEADKGIDNANRGKKTTYIFKQSPVCNG